MDYTDIFRLIGWVLVFMFPIVVIYLTGGPDKEPLLDDFEYERRKRKREAAAAAASKKSEEKKPLLEETTSKKNKKKNNKKKQQQTEVVVEEKKKAVEQPTSKKQQKTNKKAEKKAENKVVEEPKKENKVVEEPKKEDKVVEEPKMMMQDQESVDAKTKEIDEHMDPTANYARVMRIKPEEIEDEWEAVPEEEGWSQVKSRKPHHAAPKSSRVIDNNAEITEDQTIRHIPGLDKKQRENLARQAKKKQQKANADALQAERLRKHQKELEKIKIQEFYKSGKGKTSSSKRPQSTASLNEFGQLIWD